jgi:hypothetical protein
MGRYIIGPLSLFIFQSLPIKSLITAFGSIGDLVECSWITK